METNRNHLGTGFEVWNSQESWFWLVSSPHSNGAVIGAAATEAEAVREARSSIRRMAADRRAIASAARTHRASKPALREPYSSFAAVWEASLNNLDRYLTCGCSATA